MIIFVFLACSHEAAAANGKCIGSNKKRETEIEFEKSSESSSVSLCAFRCGDALCGWLVEIRFCNTAFDPRLSVGSDGGFRADRAKIQKRLSPSKANRPRDAPKVNLKRIRKKT